MNKICLVVIYNHKYEKNIPVIDRIYKGRFSHVYHVMPFAESRQENVIGVYESSYQFQGYITQAAREFRNEGYSHYVVVADDMVLAPWLNERNIIETLKLDDRSAFISDRPKVITRNMVLDWFHGLSSVAFMNQEGNACEWRKEMPSIEEARKRFEAAGLDWKQGVDANFWRYARWMMRARRLSPYMVQLFPMAKKLLRWVKCSEEKVYPLAYGYSDFLAIPSVAFDKFIHYCGVLAAMRVFVEAAIPTAMILACDRIKTLEDIGMKAENGVVDYKVRAKIEAEANFSYAKLVESFPSEYLYIHPVKLSKWKELP